MLSPRGTRYRNRHRTDLRCSRSVVTSNCVTLQSAIATPMDLLTWIPDGVKYRVLRFCMHPGDGDARNIQTADTGGQDPILGEICQRAVRDRDVRE